mmetsp:Transcript_59876/g.134505  ORF Transcript_59876/g.134505 Transcript_59876/m.134505 type:complete len:666 (+) Transcript_59876:169-2166(+)
MLATTASTATETANVLPEARSLHRARSSRSRFTSGRQALHRSKSSEESTRVARVLGVVCSGAASSSSEVYGDAGLRLGATSSLGSWPAGQDQHALRSTGLLPDAAGERTALECHDRDGLPCEEKPAAVRDQMDGQTRGSGQSFESVDVMSATPQLPSQTCEHAGSSLHDGSATQQVEEEDDDICYVDVALDELSSTDGRDSEKLDVDVRPQHSASSTLEDQAASATPEQRDVCCVHMGKLQTHRGGDAGAHDTTALEAGGPVARPSAPLEDTSVPAARHHVRRIESPTDAVDGEHLAERAAERGNETELHEQVLLGIAKPSRGSPSTYALEEGRLNTELKLTASQDAESGPCEEPEAGADQSQRSPRPRSLKELFPRFLASQLVTLWSLWLLFRDDVGRGGLDEIPVLRRRTDLRFNRDCDDLRFQLWRVFTYQFTHKDAWHLATNTLFLLMAVPLEQRLGSWRALLTFNVGVIGGACAFGVWDVHTGVIGMSAGCYAIFGSYVADALIKQNLSDERLLKLLAFIALAVGTVADYFAAPSEKVSHAAHFGGTLAGILSGIAFGDALDEKGKGTKLLVRVLTGMLAVTFAAFSLQWSMLQWPPRNLWESEAWCWTGQVRDSVTFLDWDWHCVYCNGWPCVDAWYNQSEVLEHMQAQWECARAAPSW